METDKEPSAIAGEAALSEQAPSIPANEPIASVTSTVVSAFEINSTATLLLPDSAEGRSDIAHNAVVSGSDIPPVLSGLPSAPLDTSVIDLNNDASMPSPIPQVASSAPSTDSSTRNDVQEAVTAIASGSISKEDSETISGTTQGSTSTSTVGDILSKLVDSTTQGLDPPRSTSKAASWQDIMINMLLELGFEESSRMLAAEELVLSSTQRESAPSIIAKFSKLLQHSVSGSQSPSESTDGIIGGSSKRHNTSSLDEDSIYFEGQDASKRRRVEDACDRVQENASRDEIADRMAEFMAAKREQINESNRQEFLKDRGLAEGTADGSLDSSGIEDDGCARVDARKLNRTIQMRLETVKNEALMKTNPKPHAQASETVTYNGLDERLRNIQVHLNLRLSALPACTIAERIRIVEDVIIQLERDHPLWSALHFNQPNRMFPPPPSVTTVSRNARNEIIMTGEQLHTTLIEKGDLSAHPASLAQYPSVGMSRSISGSQAGLSDVNSRSAPSISNSAAGDIHGSVASGAGRPGSATPTGAGGSATVIKLKRHGGAGSSSLARAVQQQLAQRKANAASGGYTIDESKGTFSAHNNGSVPSFKIAPNPHHSPAADFGSHSSKGGTGSLHISSGGSSPGSSFSPIMGFSDPLKPGVTGRGPIKSRRKSIAKGLDSASGMPSIPGTQTGSILGTNPGINASSIMSNSQSASMLESPAVTKSKAASAKKPRKKKGDDNGEDPSTTKPRAGAGRGKGGFGLGKGGGRPAMGLGLGKGKGGAYRQELLRRAEVEQFDDESDEGMDDGDAFQANTVTTSGAGSRVSAAAAGNGNSGTFANDNSALAQLVSSALKDHANSATIAQQQQQQQQSTVKAKKQPRKQATPIKPPPVRKFGGKSFGMAGGESSGSSSNESSDGEGSSGSQSDSSSSGSISGSDGADSD
ncbi:hypothetical protein BGZ67_010034 [Mortierella alpina]|nr:hypothetical protein BGZ67_010034 [Mortierella alpina]